VGEFSGEVINVAVSLAILTALFAMLFKWLPDTAVAWRAVLPGAVATAVLFNLSPPSAGASPPRIARAGPLRTRERSAPSPSLVGE
jgi:hypothetical protein